MKKKIIMTSHGSIIEKKTNEIVTLFKRIYDFFLKTLYIHFIDIWIATSDGEANDLRDFIKPTDEPRIIRIPLGIDKNIVVGNEEKKNFLDKWGLNENFIITYVGRLHKRKGIQYAVSALDAIHKRCTNCVLLIIGPDNGYLYELKSLINSLNLNNNVKIIGYLKKNPKELYAAYAASNAIVVPSKFENFGHVFVEAAILKKPIITSAGYTDVFDDSDVFHFDYGDVSSLAKILEDLWRTPDIAAEKIENFYKRVLKMDSWEKMVRKYEFLYKKLIRL